MKKLLFVALLASGLLSQADNSESHVEGIVKGILAEVAKVKAADPSAVPMAFWDFDGTVIKGDVSVGLANGTTNFLYKGLVQRTIEAGLAAGYDPKDGWRRFWDEDYPRFNSFGRWLAWPFLAQVLHGNAEDRLDDFCHAEYEKTYRHWYFAASYRMLRELEAAGVENYIVSGSPEIYVRNADRTLGLPRTRFRGIRTESAAGYVTPRVIHPIPSGEGKIENVRDLVLARPHGVAVAAFGNSYSTDGAFLRYVATQPSLPGGAKGTAVMINGGKVVPGYTEHFICVNQDAVVDGRRLFLR